MKNLATKQFMLRVQNLGKSFGGVHLFDGLPFHVRRGDRLAVRGPNGIGKTALLRILHGAIDADEGAIELGSRVTIGYTRRAPRTSIGR